MVRLNRYGIGALLVAALNVVFGEGLVENLGGSEAVSASINDFVNLAIVVFTAFKGTRTHDT